MRAERLTVVTLDEALKMKGKTRADAHAGPSLPEGFWKDAKILLPPMGTESKSRRSD